MRWGLLLGTAAAIAAAPLIALALLVLAGEAAGGPALLAALFVLGTALLLAAVFASDIDRLTETLRRIAFDGTMPEDGARAPRLPPIERITRSLDRLSRTLANRTRQIELLLRADEAIVERLPDPLLVLGEDRGVRRANAAGGDTTWTSRGPRAHTSAHPANRPRQTTPHCGHEHALSPARIGWPQPSRIWGPNS